MKKLIAKIRKVRATRWKKLTRGEKVMKVVMTLVKVALVVAAVVAFVRIALFIIMLVVMAYGFAGANAYTGRTYRDRYGNYWYR